MSRTSKIYTHRDELLSIREISAYRNGRSLGAIGRAGYFVSTVGGDEATIREYIRNQEKEDHRLDQLNMWK
jgi:hypothetical protein